MTKLTRQELIELYAKLEPRLLCVLKELEEQKHVASSYPPDMLSYSDEMKQIREFIEVAGEYGLAYEYIVCAIEAQPFVLSGKAAIALLEVALLLKFKTERLEDKLFDVR